MTKIDNAAVFAAWAPDGSPWTAWAKPAAFVYLSSAEQEAAPVVRDLACVPSASERCAVVVDVPGAEAVAIALALAERGYRPVPLFNACPSAPVLEVLVRTAVEVGPILNALVSAAPRLAALALPADAPPAFLLDVNRSDPAIRLEPGTFDNRSIVFASDFPSPNFLRLHDIRRVLLVHPTTKPVGDDLRHALRHWKAAGLPIESVNQDGVPVAVRWPGNGFWGELGLRLFAVFRLRRNATGGFGALIADSSGG
jgi:hypothetical protein